MNYQQVIKKINKLLLNGTKNNLIAINLKGTGFGYYYDLSTMGFTRVHRNSEMYILPIDSGIEGKVCIYVPNFHGFGTIIRVDEEETLQMGSN